MVGTIRGQVGAVVSIYSKMKDQFNKFMSDNILETIRVKRDNKQLADIAEKQCHSILELTCILREMQEKLDEITNDQDQTKDEILTSIQLLNKLIQLRVKRSINYMYQPER